MADKEKHPEIKGTSGPVELVVAIPILYAICYAIVIYGGKYIAGPALWATKKVFPENTALGITFIYVLLFISALNHLTAAAQAAGFPGGRDNKNPRLQTELFLSKTPGWIRRFTGSRDNMFENFGLFVLAVAVSADKVPEEIREHLLAIYLTLRVVFTLAYISNVDLVRSLSFIAGNVTMYMLLFYSATIGTEKGLSWEAALERFGFEAPVESSN